MRVLNVCVTLAGILAPAHAQFIISTYAGGPPVSGPALSVPLPQVNDVTSDAQGYVYLCVSYLHSVYRLDASGNLTLIAGVGAPGFSGDNGPGKSALLFSPKGLAVDTLGNLYIADTNNYRVRKLALATGVITTVAGNGNSPQPCASQPCTAGDGGPATSASLYPTSLAVDSSNNLYIADLYRVRKVTGGTITTVAGTGIAGYTGDGGAATQARLYDDGLAVDSSNSLYISDRAHSVVRRVTGGIISTAAGNGLAGFAGDGGPAISASLNSPAALACDNSGTLYIADTNNGRIRKVSGGTISSLNYSGGAGGIAAGVTGDLLVADSVGKVWKITGNSPAAAIAGSSQFYFSGDNIAAVGAAISPDGSSMALDPQGNLYFAELLNHRVRKISPFGIITTAAGTGFPGYSGDNGPASSAQLKLPSAVAVDSSGRVYIADQGNARIRMIDINGMISTFAGTGISPYNGDGLPRLAANVAPYTLAVDKTNNLYFADSSSRLRKVANGVVTDVLGTGASSGFACAAGPAGTFAISHLGAMAFDPNGTLYFSEPSSNCVLRLNNGNVERIAGAASGAWGFTGDGGPAASAELFNPAGIAFDSAGQLYIADQYNNRIRKVSGGIITTAAGNGVTLTLGYFGTFGGDGGSPASASLNQPGALAIDPAGDLFIADVGNHRVREVSTPHIGVAVTRDFDGSGHSGALLYNPANGQAYTALAAGSGVYRYAGNLFTSSFDTLRTGDFNGDRKADLVLYNSQTSLAYIGFGKGDGTFDFQSLFWSAGYNFVETGDLNGDGKTDFALYNSADGTLYTGISMGNGLFTYKYTLLIPGFTFLRLADFTGNGRADIFVYNAATGVAYLGIGDGAGAFSFHPVTVSPGYNLADIGDLNGDGKPDLLLYNSASGSAATGISDGAGGFAFTPLMFSAGFTSVRLADYTGDGKADVTAYNKTTGAAYFGTGAGNGTFNFQSLFWSPGYTSVEPQDVNADGKADVILYDFTTGTEYTGISNGNGTFTYTYQYWGPGKVLAR